ncbi:Hypothetical_protein [Hexamita inflata]|uniref:Hypothetical_protein n=1 Tax=Hexamita inflata TaxID=28002 RepID=A0AA86RBP9_9EUKA|nr:Hypothetical protein HINF_LOCUS58646 [Hexamita inflata]CAI9971003.1 Hypothetical protein HINF_LOCUS58648 [Hexamita inflata]
MASTSQQIYYLGIIGWNSGNISMQNVYATIQVQGTYFNCFAIIGLQATNSHYAELINLNTSISFSSVSGFYVGSIIGADITDNCYILNTTIVGGNIRSGSNFVGGFCGVVQSGVNLIIQNSTIQKLNISGAYLGGFVGVCQSSLQVINSKIQFVRLSGSNIGIVVGESQNGVYSIRGSTSILNYINNELIHDCSYLSNVWSYVGC